MMPSSCYGSRTTNPTTRTEMYVEQKALAQQLGKRFLQRRETKAKQFADGHYEPIHDPWKLSDLEDHLAGRATWGHYLVDNENNCRVGAFDIDLRAKGEWRADYDSEYLPISPREIWAKGKPHEIKQDLSLQMRCLAEGLALRARRSDLDIAVAYSGNKGMHVYVFFPTPIPALAARIVLEEILESFDCFERDGIHWRHRDGYRALEIEVFPKQDTIREGGLGNLMRLPLGINQKSKKPGFFVDLSHNYQLLREDDPGLALTLGSIREAL